MGRFTINPPNTQLVDAKGYITSPWYRWFSRVNGVLGDDAVAAIAAAPVLTYSATTAFSADKILTQGAGLSFTSGASTLTVALSTSGVTAASYGSASQVGTFTVDQYGRLTAAANVAIAISSSAVTGQDLTKVDDTNVTLTLGGTPTGSLLKATSLTIGWSGTLAVGRGGTGGGVASGALLDNITGFSSTGHLVRTGAGTYAFRTATGTANRIDVTNGSGVAGNPTFDISASYVGQASITTLGTIGTGTWQGTAVAAAYGGTGQSSYTAGDILYASGATALSKLAIGTSNYVLTSSGAAPQWTANTGTGNVARATQPQFTSTIGVGAAASASGSGISFPAIQSASTDANTLDDYEEGTWTPTITAGSGTFTTVSGTGEYTKIGNLVVASVDIEITTNGTAATSVIFTLPFASGSSIRKTGFGREVNSTGNQLQVLIDPTASTGSVLTYNNGYPGGSGYRIDATVTYTV